MSYSRTVPPRAAGAATGYQRSVRPAATGYQRSVHPASPGYQGSVHHTSPGYQRSVHPASPGYQRSVHPAATGYQRSVHPATPGYQRSDRPAEHDSMSPSTTQRGAVQQPRQQLHTSGFHIISPDPSKHAKLKEVDRRESEDCRKYAEARRRTTNSLLASQATSHTLGGDQLSASQVDDMRRAQEQQAQAEAKMAKYTKLREREERLAKRREREDREIEAFKQRQRAKAEKLEEKRRLQAELDREELRRKRLEYLDKSS